jgi:two-component system response regulator YesN
MRWKTSLSHQFMAIYGAIFLIIISLTFWLSYIGSTGRLESEVNTTNIALLKQVDQQIETVLKELDKDLLKLSEELEFVYFMYDSYSDTAHKYSNYYGLSGKMKGLLNADPFISSLYVYSGVSGAVLTDQTLIGGKDDPELRWLSAYMDMESYSKWITTHRIGEGTNARNVVTLVRAYPPVSSPGYRKGLLAVNIDETMLYNLIKDANGGRLGHTFVIDADGNVVTHDDKTLLFQSLKDQSYIRQLLDNHAETGHFAIERNGEKESVFYAASRYTGWKIVSIVPEEQMNRPLAVTRNLLLGLAALMFVAALSAIVLINRWTFRPLDRVLGTVRRRFRPQAAEHAPGSLMFLETVFDEVMSDREDLQKQVRDSRPIMKWRIVTDMLTGHRTDYAAVRHHLDFAGIRLYPAHYIVLSAEIGREERDVSRRDLTLYTYALCNVAEELINMENQGAAVEMKDGRAAIIISFAEADAAQNQMRALAIADLIRDMMKRHFGLTVTVGIGGYRAAMKDIAQSYEESLRALEYKMVTGADAVISIDDIQQTDTGEYYRLLQMADTAAEAVRQTDAATLAESLHAIFEEAVRSGFAPDMIRQLGFDLILKSYKTAASAGLDMQPHAGKIAAVHEQLSQCRDWREARQLAEALLMELLQLVEERRNQRGKNETVERMLSYIREHYRRSDLSLNLLADRFRLSPPYVSKLFKEHTGQNFMDYVIAIRMEASKERLADRTKKIGDIAEEAGYTNIHSFLRTFKKYTGMTPTEYRDRMAEGDAAAAPERSAD